MNESRERGGTHSLIQESVESVSLLARSLWDLCPYETRISSDPREACCTYRSPEVVLLAMEDTVTLPEVAARLYETLYQTFYEKLCGKSVKRAGRAQRVSSAFGDNSERAPYAGL